MEIAVPNKTISKIGWSEIKNIDGQFTEPSSASRNLFSCQMTYNNKEMVDWEKKDAVNFSKRPGRAYGHYNPLTDYGKMYGEPTELYLVPLVPNNGAKGPGSVSPKSSTVDGGDESPPHRAKRGKIDKDRIIEDAQGPIFGGM